MTNICFTNALAAANRKKAPPAPTPRLVIPVTATTVTAATTIAEEVIAVNNIGKNTTLRWI